MKNLVALLKELETEEIKISDGAKGKRIHQTQSGVIKSRILDAIVEDMKEAGVYADRILDGIGVDVQLDNPRVDKFSFALDAVMKPFEYDVEDLAEAYQEKLVERVERAEKAKKKNAIQYKNTTEAREMLKKETV